MHFSKKNLTVKFYVCNAKKFAFYLLNIDIYIDIAIDIVSK